MPRSRSLGIGLDGAGPAGGPACLGHLGKDACRARIPARLLVMRFKVLGPLEVVSDGDVMALPAGRAQAVLAMLVLHGNRAVSMERLIEAAWGGSGSPTARTQIQGYVSSLRRAFTARSPVAAGAG